MLIECANPAHEEIGGRIECEDGCVVAAVHNRAAARGPMSRLPSRRPDWILQSPSELTEEEVEALAVLGDAGLIPQIVAPDTAAAGEQRAPWPVRRGHRAAS